jgi:phthalate 4,5-dioxygenase oxygenase subunit
MQSDWSGIKGVAMEDLAIAVSQGPLLDRSKETLLPADRAVGRARQQLLDSAHQVAQGGDPIGVNFDVHSVVAIDANVPKHSRWQALVPAHQPRATNAITQGA